MQQAPECKNRNYSQKIKNLDREIANALKLWTELKMRNNKLSSIFLKTEKVVIICTPSVEKALRNIFPEIFFATISSKIYVECHSLNLWGRFDYFCHNNITPNTKKCPKYYKIYVSGKFSCH